MIQLKLYDERYCRYIFRIVSRQQQKKSKTVDWFPFFSFPFLSPPADTLHFNIMEKGYSSCEPKKTRKVYDGRQCRKVERRKKSSKFLRSFWIYIFLIFLDTTAAKDTMKVIVAVVVYWHSNGNCWMSQKAKKSAELPRYRKTFISYTHTLLSDICRFFSAAPAQNEKIFQLEPRKYLLICKWWSLMNFRFPFYRLEHEKNKIVWIFINEAIWIFHFPPNNLHFLVWIFEIFHFLLAVDFWFNSVYPANNL